MKTTWQYSPKIEASRLLHTARQIANHFYRINGFVVLPHWQKHLPENAVIFPHLAYHTLPRFWDKVKRLPIDQLPVTAPPQLISGLADLLTSTQPPPHTQSLKNQWQTAQAPLMTAITAVIPQAKTITDLVIMPSQYGPIMSFSRYHQHRIALHLRIPDGTIGNIAEGVLSSLTRNHVIHHLSGTWSEAEVVPDWLLTQSVLADTIARFDADYQPTLLATRGRQASKYLSQSNQYLRQLGLKLDAPLLEIVGNHIHYQNRPLKNLTPLQTTILKQLIRRQRLSSDELGNIMFTDKNAYSLYAMAKCIQRLRAKLESNGLTGSYLQTVRGFGYRLAA